MEWPAHLPLEEGGGVSDNMILLKMNGLEFVWKMIC